MEFIPYVMPQGAAAMGRVMESPLRASFFRRAHVHLLFRK
jgi:hypothetical protein